MATVYASIKALMIASLAGHTGAVQAQQGNPADETAWESVIANGTPEAAQQYLSEFPTGAHAEEAFRILVEGQLPRTTGGVGSATSVDMY
jgi:hypothetical protein